MGQTVNLLLFSFGGSNPSAPTQNAEVATAEGLCKASERVLSQLDLDKTPAKSHRDFAEIAQSIEH